MENLSEETLELTGDRGIMEMRKQVTPEATVTAIFICPKIRVCGDRVTREGHTRELSRVAGLRPLYF